LNLNRQRGGGKQERERERENERGNRRKDMKEETGEETKQAFLSFFLFFCFPYFLFRFFFSFFDNGWLFWPLEYFYLFLNGSTAVVSVLFPFFLNSNLNSLFYGMHVCINFFFLFGIFDYVPNLMWRGKLLALFSCFQWTLLKKSQLHALAYLLVIDGGVGS